LFEGRGVVRLKQIDRSLLRLCQLFDHYAVFGVLYTQVLSDINYSTIVSFCSDRVRVD